jgi:predicted MPP superfamily phosphohydrolase
MSTHLIIPDQHATPEHSNERFDWLGKLIKDLRPDVVINMGDMVDMASLSSYDRGTTSFEGKRYYKDIASGLDAQERMISPVRKSKKKMPRLVFTTGNHEDRINKAVNSDSRLEGTIGMKDLRLEEWGWEVYPFLETAIVDGIAYAHYFTSGVMGRPVGGENPGKALLNKQHMSATSGHTHTLDFATTVNAAGKRLMGLVCGVYVDYPSSWNNAQSEALWWSGVVIKRNVDHGTYDPQFVSIETLRKEYSNGKRSKAQSKPRRAKTAHR